VSVVIPWWEASWKADSRAARIADRHYNRHKVGAIQFVPPGRAFVLRHADNAVWITSWPYEEYVRHAWAGAWINSLFRNESERLSSEAIREAVALTLGHWTEPPELGLVSFVDPRKIRHKRDPGRCYLRAGFHRVGETKSGLVALQLLPSEMPEPLELIRDQGSLW
jgi:hypothetical protein